ncbi:hypothetical protein BU16DRAFT_560192 [Lophium mytilinum]|uniref:Uncharacterized protein n=1 Tax=Lophium mytilinum TaxID=390894 RepID=A0A6A6QZ25_9PEZI|nr:hypothetical protein BU16DRAFT_560192 [Lophium mytilinum]
MLHLAALSPLMLLVFLLFSLFFKFFATFIWLYIMAYILITTLIIVFRITLPANIRAQVYLDVHLLLGLALFVTHVLVTRHFQRFLQASEGYSSIKALRQATDTSTIILLTALHVVCLPPLVVGFVLRAVQRFMRR